MRTALSLVLLICSLHSLGQTKTYSNNTYQELKTQLWKITTSKEDIAVKRQKTFDAIEAIFNKYPADERNYSFMLDAINLSLPQVDSLISLIDTPLSRSQYKAYASSTRRRILITESGKRFPPLTLKDTTGKDLVIDSLKGKMVLIDVWSSGCAPCRAQIPALRKLYNQFQPKGFEVIGVSLDNEKDAWLKAIRQDKQPWANYCELKLWRNNTFANLFVIDGIPSNYLIDKEGIILGIDLSDEEIGRILKTQL